MRFCTSVEAIQTNAHAELTIKPEGREFTSVGEAVKAATELDEKYCAHCSARNPLHHMGPRCSRVIAAGIAADLSVVASVPTNRVHECAVMKTFK